MAVAFQPFSSPAELTAALSRHIVTTLQQAINQRQQASLAVSGGSTPRPLFDALSHGELEWPEVTITLVDERWVASDEPDSNEGLVRRHLLQNRAAHARFIGLKNSEPTASQGQQECCRRLAILVRPIDLVILGMGNDGHTASFFPGATALSKALALDSSRSCCAITPPTAPHERMTLTLATLLDSRQIILHLVGDDKKKVYDLALQQGPVEEMPIRAILRQKNVPVTTFWSPK